MQPVEGYIQSIFKTKMKAGKILFQRVTRDISIIVKMGIAIIKLVKPNCRQAVLREKEGPAQGMTIQDRVGPSYLEVPRCLIAKGVVPWALR